jgi:hypothetical protein
MPVNDRSIGDPHCGFVSLLQSTHRFTRFTTRAPNMPHIELGQAGHYAMAKIKEAVRAVTGG